MAAKHPAKQNSRMRGIIAVLTLICSSVVVGLESASAAVGIAVSPAVDLVDGEVVRVSGDGFEHSTMVLVECRSVDVCRPLLAEPIALIDGSFQVDVMIRRRLGSSWGSTSWWLNDCATAPGACRVEVRAPNSSISLATAPLDFDESIPLAIPEVSIAPDGPYAPGTQMTLSGTQLDPGDSVIVRWCTSNGQCNIRSEVTADSLGQVDLSVIARRFLPGVPNADCSLGGACRLEITAGSVPPVGGVIEIPILVEPGLAHALPTVSLSQSVGLTAGDWITATGSGWNGSPVVGVRLCVGSADSSCSMNRGSATVGMDGSLVGTTMILRQAGNADCAQVVGGCRLRFADSLTGETVDVPYTLSASLWPRLSGSTLSVIEGTGNTKVVKLDLRLDRPAHRRTTVTWTQRLTDMETDAYPVDEPIVFRKGETSTQMKWLVTGDRSDEPEEFMEVFLAADFALAANVTARLTVVDDDRQPFVYVGDARLIEGNLKQDVLCVPLRVSELSEHDLVIRYTTFGGTASPGSDYQAIGTNFGWQVLNGGMRSTELCIEVVGDHRRERDETVAIVVVASSRSFARDPVGVLTIANDD
jgi:hypothetical protein